ncbi:ABC transporter substrate-binding protein [Desulfobacula toluolica]|uniref:GsiB: predicted glutathione-binding protein gsiB n=1 Tax=Desulfobacula toluolica (strain DSM 7467 / Tol2) TaxID=651182 RepID=K0NCD6_DESTT|nr:ABC transporter substrate-binding protein [Desulfobacula toluolica]CCK78481.1 GsiB: predicted glutathione-binding protein gsiB [Desulfobacula toluolica Tol2]
MKLTQKILSFIIVMVIFSFSPLFAKTLRVVNFSADIPAITSLDNFDPDSYSVVTQIFDSLVHLDLNGKRVPGLAVSWRMLNKTTYQFFLRKGVKFHNGEPFDAQAVKFTYDYIIDPINKAGNAWILSPIKRIEIITPHKLKIHLKHPDGMFLYRLTMFGAICPPKYIKEKGIQEFFKHPVGTGPFKFEQWDKGKKIVLAKNPDYWDNKMPFIDKLVFKIIPKDQGTEALLNGDVDVNTNLDPKDIERVQEAGFKIMKRLVLRGYWVLMKNQGPLKDVRVRQALNYAVDKNKLIKVQGGGFGVPLASLGKFGEIGKNSTLKPYAYDIKKAGSLLAEAGYKNGFDLDMISIEQAIPLSEAIRADLKKIGVKLNIEIVSRPDWAKRIMEGKRSGSPYPGHMAVNLVDNPIMDLSFHAGLFLASDSPWSIIRDDTFDKKFLFALFQSAFLGHTKQLKLLDKYIHDQAMMLFTFQPVRVFAMKSNITMPGVGLNGHIDYLVFSRTIMQ